MLNCDWKNIVKPTRRRIFQAWELSQQNQQNVILNYLEKPHITLQQVALLEIRKLPRSLCLS